MSYRLKSRQSLANGLKRIFCEEIDLALKQTRRPPRQRGQAVHEFRKHLKKLRAAFSLAADEVGKDRHDLEDRTVRQVAKVVAKVRDAHVRLQTVIQIRKQLCDDEFGKVFEKIEGLLLLEAESFYAAFAGWEKQVVRRLKAVRERVSHWPLETLPWKQVSTAVANSYRRGRNRLADALEKPDPENFHSWRKEVKDLWYQLRLLAPLNRIVLGKIADDARTLADLLGQQHDFFFLLSRLDRERDDESMRGERAKLEKLIRKRNKKLQRAATELGRHFYAEAPKAFAKRMSIFIEDWSGSKKK
jgi:CHAD domain-containing protein